MMQQTLCPTMKICSIIKKIKVALETAEIAPSAHNGRVRIAMPKYIGCSEQGRTRRGRKQWTQHLKLIQVFCQQHPAVIVSVWHEPAVQDAFDDEHINGVVRSRVAAYMDSHDHNKGQSQSGSAVGWQCQFTALIRAPVTV
jgi:hypothetical protein